MNKRNDFIQEIFNVGSKHMIEQNKRCTAFDGGSCLYRFENLKCVAGKFITDKDYYPQMERKRIIDFPVKQFFIDSGYTEKEIVFLRQMQSIHDNALPDGWKSQLRVLASRHELQIPPWLN